MRLERMFYGLQGGRIIILPPYFFEKGGRKDMKLVIAEKPSVALSIAKVLGVNDKKDVHKVEYKR